MTDADVAGPEELAQIIIRKREEIGMTRLTLAAIAGIEPTTVGEMERGAGGLGHVHRWLAVMGALGYKITITNR